MWFRNKKTLADVDAEEAPAWMSDSSARRGRRATKRLVGIFALIFVVVGLFASLGSTQQRHRAQRIISAGAKLFDDLPFGKPAQPPLKVSVIVKTGASTAYTRLPYHIFDIGGAGNTFPGPAEHMAFLGHNVEVKRFFVSDHPMQMGGENVADILANWTARYEGDPLFSLHDYLQAQLGWNEIPRTGDDYYQLDRYKFVAMHQYAYEQDPTADWHYATDDDTVSFYPGLLRWLQSSDYSPDDYHYIGMRKGMMADGGAGHLLSRKILDTLFARKYPADKPGEADTYFYENPHVLNLLAKKWCGDCSLADVLKYIFKGKLPERNLSGGGWFFENSFNELAIQSSKWLHPVFSMHHLNGREAMKLRAMEAQLAKDMPRDMPRFCDVFSALMPDFFRQIFDAGSDSTAVKTTDRKRQEGDEALAESGDGRAEDKDDAAAPLDLAGIAKIEPFDPARPRAPMVKISQNGPMLTVENWEMRNPLKRANMTVCHEKCMDLQRGSDDSERCSSKCLDIDDCLSWTVQDHPRKCFIYHDAFSPGFKSDGKVTGYHMDRMRNAFPATLCSDQKQRAEYHHPDMRAATYFPELEGFTHIED